MPPNSDYTNNHTDRQSQQSINDIQTATTPNSEQSKSAKASKWLRSVTAVFIIVGCINGFFALSSFFEMSQIPSDLPNTVAASTGARLLYQIIISSGLGIILAISSKIKLQEARTAWIFDDDVVYKLARISIFVNLLPILFLLMAIFVLI